MNKATLAVVAFIALAAATAVLLISTADVPTELTTTPTEVLGPVFAYETPDGDHMYWHIHPTTTVQSAELPDTGAGVGELLLAAAIFGVMFAVLIVSMGYVTRKGR